MNPTPQILLAIEASNPSSSARDEGSVAVCRKSDDLEVLSIHHLRAGSRHDDALMRAVDDACREAGVTPRDIARVAVSVGPGGYTGLRIAMTTAKMMGEALNAELVAVPTARVASFGFVEDEPDRSHAAFIVALASKRGSAWCQAFRGTTALDAGALCDADGLKALISSTGSAALLADGSLPAELRAVADSAGLHVTPPRLDARLCALASNGLPTVSADELAPIYPREPEAVRKWREGD